MTEKISVLLKHIQRHADGLLDIPASEQHLAQMQIIISVALLDVRQCLEALAEEAAATKGDAL